MKYETYPHRFADIILNADYALKQEIETVIRTLRFEDVVAAFEEESETRKADGRKPPQGKQSTINAMFRKLFTERGWEAEKNVFNDLENDLAIDFWKRDVGVDIAFNHRSFFGGDLLRLQAAAEVKNVIKVGVYVCPTKEFAKVVSSKDGAAMVSFERARWYLQSFYPVLTAPTLLVGLTG